MSQVPRNNLYKSPPEHHCEEEDNGTLSKNPHHPIRRWTLTKPRNLEKTWKQSYINQRHWRKRSGRMILRPHRTFTAEDLRTPDLPFIFWASIGLPLLPEPENSMGAVFEAIDEFFTKMQEADKKFMVFSHHL